MTHSVITCDTCSDKFDLEFDGRRIVMEHEAAEVTLEDARREQNERPSFGECPTCLDIMPPEFLVGLMADAIETDGTDWLENELRYRADAYAYRDMGR